MASLEERYQTATVTDQFNLEPRISVSGKYIDWEAARTLHDLGIISTQYGKRTICGFYERESNDKQVAVIEFAIFPSDCVGYIHWIRVEKGYRQNGIAREIRSVAVDYLSNKVDSIYSKTMSEIIYEIAKSQGFKEIQYADLEGWMVYD